MVSTACSGLDSECFEIDPAYSADAARLAFVRFDVDETTTTSVIGVRDVFGGEARFLEETRVDAAEAYLSQPSWSPDGTGPAPSSYRNRWTCGRRTPTGRRTGP